MIEVDNLTKHYGNVAAIQNVSFVVSTGEVVGFLGPNAAGKTTTMRILAGYMPPSSGTARICGHDVIHESMQTRRLVGYLPETVPLYSEMTVASYLRFFARLRGVTNVEDRVEYVIDACALNQRANQVIGHLSRGYRQRVGLAQALIHDPEVLILDEPTAGLDPRQISEVRSLIRSLGGDHTIILSTHILPEASQTCSRILIINEGQIVAEDTPERLAERFLGGQRLRLRVLNPSDSAAEQLQAIEGISSVDQDGRGTFIIRCEPGVECRPQVAQLAVSSGWQLLELHSQDVSLEEVFLRLTDEQENGTSAEATH